MKKSFCLLLTMAYLSVAAMPDMKKKISQFTGDLNGDGYIDIAISDRTNYRDLFGFVKVFFGTAEGISNTPGWTYKCDRSNFLESQYFVSIIGDVNGDGMDELCLLLTNLSNEKSGRSHQDLFLFYGKKDGFGNTPEILKIETDNKDKSSLRYFFGFDYNGDGYIDILAVSAKRNYHPIQTSWTDIDKKLILFRGGSSGISKSFETMKEIDDIVFRTAGDINNDGYADMLIAESTPKGVRLMHYLGRKNNTPDSKLFLDLILPKATSGDQTFNNIAWDYNGDNFDDDYIMYVDVGTFWTLKKKPDSTINRFEFYSGTPDGLKDSVTYTWSYKTATGTILHFTSCGDLNKDGFGDFVLQRFISQPKKAALMEANLIWGSKDGLHLDTTNTFDKLFHSAYLVNDGFTSVIPLSDINNDGYADMLLGVETIVYGNKDGNFKTVQLKFLD